MTQPNPAAPGAPADPATPAGPTAPGAPAPTAPTQQQPTAPGLDPNTPVDVASLPPNVQKMIADLRKEAGTNRTTRTAAETAAADAIAQRDKVLAALGLNPDGTALADPEAAAAQLASRAETAEGQAWSANVKLAIFQAAPDLGANAARLLNSVSFLDSLDELVDADPMSADFRTALEAKIKEEVAKDPTLKTVAGPARQGADISGSGGTTNRPNSLGAAIAARLSGSK